MKLEILGTRGNIGVKAPNYENQSGILLDNKILLDLGEKEYVDFEPDYIFISHLHPDHAVFEREDISTDIPVYAPEPSSFQPVTVISDVVTVDSYKVTPVGTIHSTRVKSVAFLVQKDTTVFYTSDIVELESPLTMPVDLAIIDGSFMRKGGLIRYNEKGQKFGHTGIRTLVQKFKSLADSIVVTHFGSWFYRDIEESIRKIESLGNRTRVTAAYDGMVVQL